MNRCNRWLACAFAVSFVLAACPDIQAQYRGSRPLRRSRRSSVTDQPAISPYLSLTNPNADVGANYAALTAPMLQQQEASTRNAQAIRRLQFDTGEAGIYGATGGLRSTGHAATYMNFSHWYGEGGQGMGGGRSSGSFQRRRSSIGGGGGGMMGGGMGMGGMGMGGMGMF
jgi:hypothetical protein